MSECDAIQAHADTIADQYETLQQLFSSQGNDLKFCREDKDELKSRMLEEAEMMVEKEVLTLKNESQKVLEEKNKSMATQQMGYESKINEANAEIQRLLQLTKSSGLTDQTHGDHIVDLTRHYPTRVILLAKDSLEPFVGPVMDTILAGKESIEKVSGDARTIYSESIVPTTVHIYRTASNSVSDLFNTHVDPLVVSAEEASGVTRAQLKRTSSDVYKSSSMIMNDFKPLAHSTLAQGKDFVRTTSTLGSTYINSALEQNPTMKSFLPGSKTEILEMGAFTVVVYSVILTTMYFGRIAAAVGRNSVSCVLSMLTSVVSALLQLLQIPLFILTCGQCRKRKETLSKAETATKPTRKAGKGPKGTQTRNRTK